MIKQWVERQTGGGWANGGWRWRGRYGMYSDGRVEITGRMVNETGWVEGEQDKS